MISDGQCIRNSAQLLGNIQLEVDLITELGYEVFLVGILSLSDGIKATKGVLEAHFHRDYKLCVIGAIPSATLVPTMGTTTTADAIGRWAHFNIKLHFLTVNLFRVILSLICKTRYNKMSLCVVKK